MHAATFQDELKLAALQEANNFQAIVEAEDFNAEEAAEEDEEFDAKLALLDKEYLTTTLEKYREYMDG